MKPKLSQIQCVGAFVSEISTKANFNFNVNEEAKLNYDNLEIESKLLIEEKGQPRQVTVKVSLDASSEENAPYSFSVEVIGFFNDQNVPEENRDRFIEVQGSSVLYGMARDALLDIMTKGPFDSVFLPLVSFYTNGGEKIAVKSGPKKTTKRSAKKTARETKSW